MNIMRTAIFPSLISCIIFSTVSVHAQTATHLDCNKCINPFDTTSRPIPNAKRGEGAVTRGEIRENSVNDAKLSSDVAPESIPRVVIKVYELRIAILEAQVAALEAIAVPTTFAGGIPIGSPIVFKDSTAAAFINYQDYWVWVVLSSGQVSNTNPVILHDALDCTGQAYVGSWNGSSEQG